MSIFFRIPRLLGALVISAVTALSMTAAHAQTSAGQTEWGWPTPYQKVSDKSVKWLQDKGWWPLQIAYQPPWSGQNTMNIVMDRAGLLKQRGLETKLTGFASGPAINEVIVSGRFQVANGGNFPFTSLLDKKVPVKGIAITSPNLLHAVIVPLDSPLKSLKDIKNAANKPLTIGLVTGSSAEFYIQTAAQLNGFEIGKDVILKNMPPGEQLAMTKGIAAVLAWDPTASIIVNERKTGRIIDSIFPYNMFSGQLYVRAELVENVPDVVQAISDAALESTLWTRKYPEKAVEYMQEDPNLKNYSKELLLQQVHTYNNLYKPTYLFPHSEFWGRVNGNIFKWMHEQKRIVTPLTGKDFADAFDEKFMRQSFAKAGLTVPAQPPFLPSNWRGKPETPPYPEYTHVLNTKTPQPFPAPEDLIKR